jgi:hypothetical protein
MQTITEARGLDRAEIIKGLIKGMNNYGYVEDYIGQEIAEVIYVLEQEE